MAITDRGIYLFVELLNVRENYNRGKYMKKHLLGHSYPARLLGLLVILVLIGSTDVIAGTRQEHVHQMAHSVMPFDISKTMHIFKMTEYGGVLRVIAKDPGANDQIALIQQHLQHEAEKFQQGDFSDPGKLHGADMAGLKDLQTGAAQIKIAYEALPSGAEIIFKTTDLHILTALHRWFGAQLSEHGADATSE
jgi:hypothetical protein